MLMCQRTLCNFTVSSWFISLLYFSYIMLHISTIILEVCFIHTELDTIALHSIALYTCSRTVLCQTQIYQTLSKVGLGPFCHSCTETFLPHRQMSVAVAALYSLPSIPVDLKHQIQFT